MPVSLQRYATPMIVGLFVVSLVSGVALFFHFGQGAFHGMHEWLSMVLIAPFILHLWRNWRPMTAYFSKPAFGVSLVLRGAAALAFVFASGGAVGRRGPPQLALAVVHATPAQLAPALGASPESLVAALKAHGFAAAALDAPSAELVASSGQDEGALYAALTSAAAP